ncbi:MAG TPA: endonuclease domain-containing protein [Rhodanobacteraceae bacterium]|nr:endonuclease domain-containing protein [Rhodanobacteraceae bacterium]
MQIKPPLPTRTRKSARDLRHESTDAERALWYRLRAGRLNGLKFRRQHPIPPYIADFYCQEAELIVELDGSQHNPHADAARTTALERQGFKILRFWDNEVLQEMDSVLEAIGSTARTRTLTHPFGAPSPEGRGEKPRVSLRDGEGT